MDEFVWFNGRFHKKDAPLITAGNRGLRYGDGLFETLRFTDGQVHFANWHMDRLFKGLHLLSFEPPAYFTSAYLLEQVSSLCKKNGHKQARIRINIIRGNGGLYDPDNHFPHCIIESWHLPDAYFTLNVNGLVTGIYQQARKTMDDFSSIKSNNYLPYAMAALQAKKNKWNDAILLNTAGRICDTSMANVFIVKNGILYTPAVKEGAVAGILQRYLLEKLPTRGFVVEQAPITPDDLLGADEIFFTNAIKGIRWVAQCDTSHYNSHTSSQVFQKLLKK